MLRKVARRSRVGARREATSRHAGAGDEAIHRSHPLLALQRTIGNQAAARLLQREEAPRSAIFLTLEFQRAGVLKGESKSPGHEGKIELISLDLNPGKQAGGGLGVGTSAGAEAEKKATQDIEFTKANDSTSSAMLKALTEGEPIKTAVIESTKADDKGKFVPFLTQKFKDGYLTNIRFSGGEGDVDVVEEISLNATRA